MKQCGIILTVLLLVQAAKADVTDTFRHDNAVVLYEFNDTDNYVRDTANAKFGSPLNLKIMAGSPARSPGVLNLTGATQIRSEVPGTKLYNACKMSNEMSVELVIENNESSQKRTGVDANKVLQPLRILTFSNFDPAYNPKTAMSGRNFAIGQVYDAGDMYSNAVTNTGNGDKLFSEPLESTVDATFVPTESGTTIRQKLIFTFKKGTVKLYLSDRQGHLYLHKTGGNNFNGDLSNWDPGALLVMGNEYVRDSKYYSYDDTFSSCDPARDPSCAINPNRYWKGKIYLAAVYCKALAEEDIFPAQQNLVVANPLFQINTNLQITPELKRAQDIYSRITGIKTPLVNPVLEQMAKKLIANDPVGAADLATQDPNFLNVTVRDFAARMSNRDETINVNLNDFTATIIGAVKDQISAQRLLSDDIVYVANPNMVAVPSDPELDMVKSNNHYDALSTSRFDLGKILVASTQKVYDGKNVVPNPTPAGLLTSRQWIAAHAIAGTNRRPVEYTFREFLCTPLEKVADSTGPDNVIGRDVDRFPGGSHSKFTTTCRACHTIMDGFRGAFSHFTFSNNMVKHGYVSPPVTQVTDEAKSSGMAQNPTYITEKVNHNDTVFPEGRVIVDDTWWNNAVNGINASTFEWKATTGKGIKEFGQLIAGSKAFPKCMATRVFTSLCKRAPASTDDKMLTDVANEFATNRNYNLKYLFEKIVTTTECLGEAQ